PAAPSAPAAPASAPAAAPPAAAPAPAAQGKGRGALVHIRPDGSEGESFPLGDKETMVGRDAGGVFGADFYLSPKHAMFFFAGDALKVRDEDSLNGIYVRIER